MDDRKSAGDVDLEISEYQAVPPQDSTTSEDFPAAKPLELREPEMPASACARDGAEHGPENEEPVAEPTNEDRATVGETARAAAMVAAMAACAERTLRELLLEEGYGQAAVDAFVDAFVAAGRNRLNNLPFCQLKDSFLDALARNSGFLTRRLAVLDRRGDAAEHVQVALYRMCKFIKKGGALPRVPRAWSLRVTMNCWRDAGRRKASRAETALSGEMAEALSDNGPKPDEVLSEKEEVGKFQAAVVEFQAAYDKFRSGLSPLEQAVFNLIEKGDTEPQVAEQLGRTLLEEKALRRRKRTTEPQVAEQLGRTLLNKVKTIRRRLKRRAADLGLSRNFFVAE